MPLVFRFLGKHTSRLVAGLSIAVALGSSPVSGQECRDREQPSPAYTAEDGLRLSVIRAGVIKQDNPLRPLSTELLTIWHVTVNGKPGFLRHATPGVLEELRSLEEIEYVNSRPVFWSHPPTHAPPEITIITTKRSTVGPFRFAGCEQRSRIPVPKSAENVLTGKERADTRSPLAPSARLPEGAVSDCQSLGLGKARGC